MEDDITLARRHNDITMVAIHIHDRSHHRAYGIQDTTPPNDEITFRRAIDAGADLVLGSGPHVLRGIEIYKGKPIFYSLSNFIYQYRTPEKIPVDLVHQRDGEVERPANVSVWDRRDHPRTFEGVMLRLTVNKEKLRRIELIPFTIDDEGPLYGVPRLASDQRGREIIERLQQLSKPYGTLIVSKGWYAEVVVVSVAGTGPAPILPARPGRSDLNYFSGCGNLQSDQLRRKEMKIRKFNLNWQSVLLGVVLCAVLALVYCRQQGRRAPRWAAASDDAAGAVNMNDVGEQNQPLERKSTPCRSAWSHRAEDRRPDDGMDVMHHVLKLVDTMDKKLPRR